MPVSAYLELLDWRRRVAELFGERYARKPNRNGEDPLQSLDHRYDVAVKAVDYSSNSFTTTNQFKYDIGRPTSTITTPAPGQRTSFTTIAGTANDTVGSPTYASGLSASGVQVAVKSFGRISDAGHLQQSLPGRPKVLNLLAGGAAERISVRASHESAPF